MVASETFEPAIKVARSKSALERHSAAIKGTVGALDDWRTESPRFGTNRKADGLGAIDKAVAQLRENVAQLRENSAKDYLVKDLLDACSDWLKNRRVFGARVTGWREPAIQNLYWRAAWGYSCDKYASKALTTISNNNLLGVPTSLKQPVCASGSTGNPYYFENNSDYCHERVKEEMYRGDLRSPWIISDSDGFQPINFSLPQKYAPWFHGASSGGTISVTTDSQLAIDAVAAARVITDQPKNHKDGERWMGQVLTRGLQGCYGYVYEFREMPDTESTRRRDQRPGREQVFLALPKAVIAYWWIVLPDWKTAGPFLFPPEDNAPVIERMISEKKRWLAGRPPPS